MNPNTKIQPENSAPRTASPFVTGAVCLTLGIGIGAASVAPTAARQNAGPAARTAVNPQERTLDANLYVQTAAEYRAVCLQTYGWAEERLRQKIAALPPTADGTGAPAMRPAVVMDLDETVLDNAGFQSWLDERGLTYSQALWDDWERTHAADVRLVPGAKAFIDSAERMGVAVVYVTNRAKKNRAGTVATLKQLGLNTSGIDGLPAGDEGRLLLQDGPSDKTARRAQAEKAYRVLLYVGDNLRDFSEEFASPRAPQGASAVTAGTQAIATRNAAVDRNAYRFGTDWFLLPNPVYGEWQKPFGEGTGAARAFLRRPTTPITAAPPGPATR